MRLRWQICFCGSSVSKDEAPPANLAYLFWQIFGSGGSVGNHFALTANLASRQLSRQIFGSVGKYLAPSANIWLCRQRIGSVGQFGFCGSSIGKYLDPAALSAIMSLRRQIWLLGSSVGKYLGLLANIWLFGSISSSVGK
jgi:hypothetical protein